MNAYETVLRRARGRIEDGRDEYICDALGIPCKAAEEEYAVFLLRGVVMERLSPSRSLVGWLARAHNIDDSVTDRARLRRTRIAWIDSLIQEFK